MAAERRQDIGTDNNEQILVHPCLGSALQVTQNRVECNMAISFLTQSRSQQTEMFSHNPPPKKKTVAARRFAPLDIVIYNAWRVAAHNNIDFLL